MENGGGFRNFKINVREKPVLVKFWDPQAIVYRHRKMIKISIVKVTTSRANG